MDKCRYLISMASSTSQVASFPEWFFHITIVEATSSNEAPLSIYGLKKIKITMARFSFYPNLVIAFIGDSQKKYIVDCWGFQIRFTNIGISPLSSNGPFSLMHIRLLLYYFFPFSSYDWVLENPILVVASRNHNLSQWYLSLHIQGHISS